MRNINKTKQQELYADIRKKNAKQILGDGNYWWVTSGGMPSARISTEQIPQMVEHLKKVIAERGSPPNKPGLSHTFGSRRMNWKEMQEFAKEIAKEV